MLQYVIGLWPILWHTAVVLPIIVGLVLVSLGTLSLQAILGATAMGWVREAAAALAIALGMFWLGMVVQHHSDAKAYKKEMEVARASAIKQAQTARRRAVGNVAHGVCDPRDTSCGK